MNICPWSLWGSILEAFVLPGRPQEVLERQVGDVEADFWVEMDAPRVDFESQLAHRGSLKSILWGKMTT